jgi:hypothetical protein
LLSFSLGKALHDGKRARHQHGAKNAEESPERDHATDRADLADSKGTSGKAGYAEEEHEAAAETVTHLPHRNEQNGEREQIRVHDPLQVVERTVQGTGDIWVGDNDDGGVESHHRHTEPHNYKRQEGISPQAYRAFPDIGAGRCFCARHVPAHVHNSSLALSAF